MTVFSPQFITSAQKTKITAKLSSLTTYTPTENYTYHEHVAKTPIFATQVVAATSQGIATAIRPQVSSTLAGALANIKVQGAAGSQAQQTLFSQMSAALQGQNVGVRQGSPVRIQTAGGTPIVAVSVQNAPAGSSPQQPNVDRTEQVSRFLKK